MVTRLNMILFNSSTKFSIESVLIQYPLYYTDLPVPAVTKFFHEQKLSNSQLVC
jgi:hypothetical protein